MNFGIFVYKLVLFQDETTKPNNGCFDSTIILNFQRRLLIKRSGAPIQLVLALQKLKRNTNVQGIFN